MSAHSAARYKPAGAGCSRIQPSYTAPHNQHPLPYNGIGVNPTTNYQHNARRYRQQPTATISVGGDDWANQVINNVVGDHHAVSGDHSPSDVHNNNAAVVLERIDEKKSKFHADRTLELKNLPDGVTEQDIRLALPDVDIIRVELDRPDVRHRPGAKLYLKHPHILDSWPAHRDSVYVRNKEVNLCLGTSDKWLCVARLPLTYTEEQLIDMMAAYGRIKHSFLVCSEVTGESKGYGLVKYESQEAASQAKQFLNGSILEAEAIQVDWLNSSFIQYSQLHSKCLYVSNLPPNFRDLAQFRKIFSVVKNPPYCQIAMKNGVLQDWGLVEFFDHMDAERTQQEIDGYNLNNYNIRVLYCIPGVNAINIYMSLVTAPDTVSKKGLVDEVPSSTVYAQLQKLATQNPAFAQNLQGIIQNHIDKSADPGSLPDNPADQAALMILMAAQHQEQAENKDGGGSTLLHNQEVVEVLENLVCGSRNVQQQDEQVDPYAQLMRIPSLQLVLGHNASSSATSQNGHSAGTVAQRSINTASPPPVIANNLNLLNNTQTLNEMLGSLKANSSGRQSESVSPNPELNSLLPLVPHTMPPIGDSLPDFSKPPPLLASPSPLQQPPVNRYLSPPPPPALPTPTTSPMTMAYSPLFPNSGMFVQTPTSQGPSPIPHTLFQPNQQLLTTPPHLSFGSPFLGLPPTLGLPNLPAGMYMPGLEGLLTPPLHHHHPGLVQQQAPTTTAMFFNPLTGGLMTGLHPSQAQGLLQLPPLTAAPPPSMSMPPPQSPALMPTQPPTIMPPQPPTVMPPPLPSVSLSGGVMGLPSPPIHPPGSVVTSTPYSMKRKASILPNPEESPEGRRYIGQHSQGLGGHYAESYWSNKRTKYS